MGLYKKLVLIAFLLVPALGRCQVEGVPAVDFQRYFPHSIAVSEAAKNAEFPGGVQYKFLAVRDEQEKVVIIALIRRDGPVHVSRLLLAQGPIDTAERALKTSVARFSEKVNLKFEFFDLRDVRNMDDFSARAADLGWESQPLQSN
jgi:hypothetical protein